MCWCGRGFAAGNDSPFMAALLQSALEVDERTVHPVRQFYDLFTKVCARQCYRCGQHHESRKRTKPKTRTCLSRHRLHLPVLN